MSRIVKTSRQLSLLAYPPPYKSWLAISSDPDFTLQENWQEVHDLIWNELKLPLADSFFIFNRNLQAPDQISLETHPECIKAHPHDTVHTWGDFIFSGNYRFTRQDAIDGLALLETHGLSPKVWTDHSNFVGNLVHRPHTQAKQTIKDASGATYHNDLYTVDLIKAAGIRYIWDGALAKAPIGQDRALSRREWYAHTAERYAPNRRAVIAVLDILTQPFSEFRNPKVFTYSAQCNRQYEKFSFPDGNEFYRFKRFGRWRLADIDNVDQVLSHSTMNKLIEAQGTMIVYTHFGKRHARQNADETHIPQATRDAMSLLSEAHKSGSINLSATSLLLDYLVLRDNVTISSDAIHFHSDGIRFDALTRKDLHGHSFGLTDTPPGLRVFCGEVEVKDFECEPIGNNCLLKF